MGKGGSSRRDFLKGKAAAKAVGDWIDRPGEEQPDPGPDRAALLVQVARRAMGTEFQVILNAQQHPRGPEAALEALDRVEQLEAQLSVYRADSEVSQLNRRAAGEAVEVEEGLLRLLETAVDLHRQTGGAFDITAGPLSRAWGFHQRRGKWPEDEQLQAARELVGSDAIELDPQARSVRYLRAGLEINLGAIGKGWALDEAAWKMELGGVDDFLIHGGRSSVIARGSRHGRDGWPIGLIHPLVPQQRLGEFDLRDRAMGTSGCGNQFFHHQGRRLSHILDPRSGHPAEGVLSATVLTPDATRADALATALYVMGPEEAERLVAQHQDMAALLVLPGAKSGGVQLLTLGDLQDAWRPAKP